MSGYGQRDHMTPEASELAALKQRLAELSTGNEALQAKLRQCAATTASLRDNEQRYAGILNAQQTLLVRADTSNRITYMNDAYARTFGLKVGQTFFVAIHPDDIAATNRALEQLKLPPHTCSLEQRALVRGEWRWIYWEDSVVLDAAGNIVEVQGVGVDIHDRKEAEAALRQSEAHYREAAEANRRLLLELDHRVRNNLAGLQGLIALMRRKCSDVDSFADAINARLIAMAQVQNLLANTSWRAVELRVLVASLLEALHGLSRHPISVSLDGPEILIKPRHTLPLAMTLLEWFTNSCKYGAHSVATGRVNITWRHGPDDPRRVHLRWQESGGPPVAQPVVPSVGTDLVRSFVTLELRGNCLLRFAPSGVDHEIQFPLSVDSAHS